MRVEFRQGVPEGCDSWLWDNVGPGNISLNRVGIVGTKDSSHYAWFYKRVSMPVPLGDAEPHYVPTITVKDPKLALLFMLRWV